MTSAGELRVARSEARRDRGSAAPLAVAMVAVAVTLALLLAGSGAVLRDASAARGAADLAALAAARVDRDHRALGWSRRAALAAGCDEARVVAELNHAEMTGCLRGAGLSVVVTVSVRPAGGTWDQRASSRAGPSR